jgi:DNA polymerase IIIc chi subunit
MTEVLLYHLQDVSLESVLPSLLEKSLERGWRVVVQSTSEERADALDAHLWTYRDDSFLPHTTIRIGPTSGFWLTVLPCRLTPLHMSGSLWFSMATMPMR